MVTTKNSRQFVLKGKLNLAKFDLWHIIFSKYDHNFPNVYRLVTLSKKFPL